MDHEWYSQSSIMPGQQTILTPGQDHPRGLGAVRKITIDKIELTEEILGFEAPGYFCYGVRDGGSGMPVKGYRGEFFMEPRENGMLFRYRGSFEPKLAGTNWLFISLFKWRMRTMVPVWQEGYNAYHGFT